MECSTAVDQTRGQVMNLPDDIHRIVVPIGSGMSAAGVLWGLADHHLSVPVLGVVIGADPTRRLDRFAPPTWRMIMGLVPAGLDYHAEVRDATIGGVHLDGVYEAKCLPFLAAGDLLWIVGRRNN
jgi:1-aminocyclopropane-1-carboxylate deaminase/D-cysteine desulfhydrase-like pyridoxal-dependent ACC family enzyme